MSDDYSYGEDDREREREREEREGKEENRRFKDRVRREVSERNDVANVGKLIVEVIEARDLIKADAFSKSDPFVNLTLNGKTKRTKVIKNDHEPKWKERFSFANIRTGDESLFLECWDDDGGGNKDPLGTCEIPLEDLEGSRTVDMWFNLRQEGARRHRGEVHLKCQYFPPKDKADEIAQRGKARGLASSSSGSRKGRRGDDRDAYGYNDDDESRAEDEGSSLFALGALFGCCASRRSEAEARSGSSTRERRRRRKEWYGSNRGDEDGDGSGGQELEERVSRRSSSSNRRSSSRQRR